MGVGMVELAVIFVVALLVLGPARSLDMARTMGRILRELRRSVAEVNAAMDLEGNRQSDRTRPPPETGPPTPSTPPDDGEAGRNRP